MFRCCSGICAPARPGSAITVPVEHFISTWGYLAIFLLCMAESCCVPTSSELTMGFAGVLAATGHMDLPGAILVGATGEVVGAYVAWVVGRFAGRSFVDRWGKYLLITHHDLDRAEGWYGRHETWGVFGGRLVPVLRNFVALPAGIAEVPLFRFGVLTALGSLIWDAGLAGIGYAVGSHWHAVIHGFSEAGYVVAVIVVIAIAAFFWHRISAYRRQRDLDRAPGRHSAGRSRMASGVPVPTGTGAGGSEATGGRDTGANASTAPGQSQDQLAYAEPSRAESLPRSAVRVLDAREARAPSLDSPPPGHQGRTS